MKTKTSRQTVNFKAAPMEGSGAKSAPGSGRSRLPGGSNVYPDYAASTERQLSGIVAVVPPSLPILN